MFARILATFTLVFVDGVALAFPPLLTWYETDDEHSSPYKAVLAHFR